MRNGGMGVSNMYTYNCHVPRGPDHTSIQQSQLVCMRMALLASPMHQAQYTVLYELASPFFVGRFLLLVTRPIYDRASAPLILFMVAFLSAGPMSLKLSAK